MVAHAWNVPQRTKHFVDRLVKAYQNPDEVHLNRRDLKRLVEVEAESLVSSTAGVRFLRLQDPSYGWLHQYNLFFGYECLRRWLLQLGDLSPLEENTIREKFREIVLERRLNKTLVRTASPV